MAAQYEIDIKVNSKDYKTLEQGFRNVRRGLDSKNTIDVFKKELRVFLNDIATDMEKRHSTGYPAGTSSNSLSRRTGAGVESIRRSINVKGTNLRTLMGSIGGLKRLAIHEFGGTIKGRGKHLAIPLPDALNSRGVPKRQSPRDWSNTKLLMSKNGNLVIYREIGSSRKELLYVLIGPKSRLKKITFKDTVSASVKGSGIAPARLGMRRAVDKKIGAFGDKLAKAITAELNRELESA